MAKYKSDGSILMEDGRVLYADTPLLAQDIFELIQIAQPPSWPFVSGGGGAAGPAGPQGVAGMSAMVGFQGPQGPVGTQGFQGSQGAQGSQGNQGLSGGSANLTTKTANYTILVTDSIILVDTSGGAFTLTLPDPATATVAGVAHFFYIVDETGFLATNNLTLARFAGELLEGLAASKVFQTAWGGWTVFSDGTDWFVF